VRLEATAQRDAGFTLIEMMIVVAIIGVLASAAIPAFMRYMSKARCVEGIHNVEKIADGVRAYYDAHSKVPGNKVGAGMYSGTFYGPIFGTNTVCLHHGGIYPQSALNPFFTTPGHKQVADMVMFKPEGQTVRYYYYHTAQSSSGAVTGFTHSVRYTNCGTKNILHIHRMNYEVSDGALVVKGPLFHEINF